VENVSWNAVFHLVAAWGLRLNRVPVVHFVCKRGATLCVLGTNPFKSMDKPPCERCTQQSGAFYAGANVIPAHFLPDPALDARLKDLSLPELMTFETQMQVDGEMLSIPLGALCLPGLRWILRRHHLNDDEPTRYFLREYIRSAWSIARAFDAALETVQPRAVLVFNGQFFPEATAKWVAKQRGVRVITQEVGFQPKSVFFTEGEATAYPISIPEDFELNEAQNARLDAYLQQRFRGNFSMAGIKFWAGMQGLDEDFLALAARFEQIVPVFTNVVFDTSQPHANVLFEDMFTWLDGLLEVMKRHPRTLFVVRAHPDETRPGKEAAESVQAWAQARGIASLPNVRFVPSQEQISSYELIERAKVTIIYNSTIGLEAAILGKPVLAAGKARFTPYPCVFFPNSAAEYWAQLEQFLSAPQVSVPAHFRRNARRFLYYQLYKTSLPMDAFAEPSYYPSLARFIKFDPAQLNAEHSSTMRTIVQGFAENGDFLLPDDAWKEQQ
jgi:hypothetical protein